MCTQCPVAWFACTSPAIGGRAGGGRGWRIDADGCLAKEQGAMGAGLWARSRPCSYEGETNWSDSDKWTISSSPTASCVPLKLLSQPRSSSFLPTMLFFQPHCALSYISTFLFLLLFSSVLWWRESVGCFCIRRGPAAFNYKVIVVDCSVCLTGWFKHARILLPCFCFMSTMRLTWHLNTINCLACFNILSLLSGIVIAGCH